MRNRTDRLNRVLLAVVGVILMLVGVGALLIGLGALGGARARQSLLYPRAAQLLHRQEAWIWWVLGAAGLAVGVAALGWFAVQMRLERTSAVVLADSGEGTFTVAATALCDAVCEEAESITGVERARAHLANGKHDPHLALSVWLAETADVGRVRDQLDHTVIAHAREAVGRDELRIWLRMEVAPTDGPRVR